MAKKNAAFHIGNNNNEVNVIIGNDEYIRELHETIKHFAADLTWAEDQLKLKDLVIEQLLKRLKSYERNKQRLL